jgi:ankyrin repeat protein
LWYLAFEGNLDGLRQELAAGAKPSAPDDAGYTPLHVAVQERQIAIIELLLQAGANPNATGKYGNGPLGTAVMNARGDNQIVEMLLRAGADPHHKNNHGHSPYEMAGIIDRGLEKPFARLGGPPTQS